jgi:electron transport complex protein RnfE
MTKKENFLKGLIKENPIFVSLLGMCPALAVTSSFETAIGMGLLVIFVLTMSNLVISLLRNVIPSDVRTPAYIVIIATFVTIVRMATEAVSLSLYDALGVFIPLIVVNCVILGRAEAFASKNKVTDSILDGLGMGLGFTLALAVIGTVRELKIICYLCLV